jgi:hypothetical protein
VAELEALLAAAERRVDADAAIDRLESLLLRFGYFYGREPYDVHAANLVVARLRAARRHTYQPVFGSPYLSSYLREEGRLAAATGDRAGAVRAYRHFLLLRADPEPSLRAEAADARAALARLEGDSASR